MSRALTDLSEREIVALAIPLEEERPCEKRSPRLWLGCLLVLGVASSAVAQPKRYLLGDMWVSELPRSSDIAGPSSANGGLGFVPWPNGVVPLLYDAVLSTEQRHQVARVCGEWAKLAHVVCVDKAPSHTQWVRVGIGPPGCSATLGAFATGIGEGVLWLSEAWCWDDRTIFHEFGHIFGLIHEHQRSDRDSYITVHFENIAPESRGGFERLPETVHYTGYDFQSIMHYFDTSYVLPGAGPAMTSHTPPGQFLGSLTGLPTASDAAGVAALYGTTPHPLPVPEAPSIRSLGGNLIQISWTAPAAHPAATYSIELSPDAQFINPVRRYLYGTGAATVGAGSIWKGLVWARVNGHVGGTVASSIPLSGTTVGAETAPWLAVPRVVGNDLELGWYGHGGTFTLDFRATPAGPVLFSVPVDAQTWVLPNAASGTWYVTVTDYASRVSNQLRFVMP